MSHPQTFELPETIETLLRDAGYVPRMTVTKEDGTPWTEHDESSVRAMIAGVEADLSFARNDRP